MGISKMETVIEYAEKRLRECEPHDKAYWAAYLDGARAQEKESKESHAQLLETTEILYNALHEYEKKYGELEE